MRTHAARDHIINFMIDEREGGYSNHRSDSGRATRWGITEGYARRRGYHGDMRDLPRELAFSWYVEDWDRLQGDTLAEMSDLIAEEVFDTATNMGPGVAVRFLQRCLNALNRRQDDYADIEVDGGIGSETLSALSDFLGKRGQAGETVILRMLNSLQGERYIHLAERREKDEAFIFGWFNTRVSM